MTWLLGYSGLSSDLANTKPSDGIFCPLLAHWSTQSARLASEDVYWSVNIRNRSNWVTRRKVTSHWPTSTVGNALMTQVPFWWRFRLKFSAVFTSVFFCIICAKFLSHLSKSRGVYFYRVQGHFPLHLEITSSYRVFKRSVEYQFRWPLQSPTRQVPKNLAPIVFDIHFEWWVYEFEVNLIISAFWPRNRSLPVTWALEVILILFYSTSILAVTAIHSIGYNAVTVTRRAIYAKRLGPVVALWPEVARLVLNLPKGFCKSF